MTNFNDYIEDVLDALYDTFGVTATYDPIDATPSESVIVIVEYGRGIPAERGADSMGVDATVRVQVKDIVEPAPGDQFTIGSDIWEVLNADKSTCGQEWIMSVHRMTR